MIKERIYYIGILVYYFLIISITALCFIFLWLRISDSIDTFCVSTISFILGKFFTLVSGKLIKFHHESVNTSKD